VNVSIAAHPEVIAGDKHATGLAAVLDAVKTHRAELECEWDALRPDDQKLENSKRRTTTEKKKAQKQKR
jgi:hypothetical protein